jgi:hypothetical protein
MQRSLLPEKCPPAELLTSRVAAPTSAQLSWLREPDRGSVAPAG